ncbi:MAG: GMP synthase-like glutamine amidotransferase, partial [Cocleimonas sp.]
CPIAAYQTGPMLGIQGHPEFDYNYTKYLFDKHQETLNEESKNTAAYSFKQKPDSNTVGAWMVDFIKSRLAVV